MRHRVYRDQRVHVLAERCSTCIFRPGNLMQLRSGRLRAMLAQARSHDGGSVVCHQTLHDGSPPRHAVCRGWFDRFAHEHVSFRLAIALGAIEEVPPPKEPAR